MQETTYTNGSKEFKVYEDLDEMTEDTKRKLGQADVKHVKLQKVGRNDPCPCGSGRKFKKCCLESQRGRIPAKKVVS